MVIRFRQSPLLFMLLLTVVLWGCNGQDKKNQETSTPAKLSEAQKKGKALIATQCASCHDGSTPMEARIGPPMIAIQRRYLKEYKNKEDLAQAIHSFVNHPSKDKALMQGAVQRFGLMPAMPSKEQDIENLADYLLHHELNAPEGFEEHYQKHHSQKKPKRRRQGKHKGSTEAPSYAQLGKRYAMQTKKTLGKNLMRALKTGGPLHALEFCHVRAYPLTDSMAKQLKVSIRRVSDRPRNPKNAADENETEIIKQFKAQLAEGGKPEGHLNRNQEGQILAYYPIITNGMCLQCHGKVGKELKPKTYKKIKSLYPNDQAVGYRAGEVRGAWGIRMSDTENLPLYTKN